MIDRDGNGYKNEEFGEFEKNANGLVLTSIKSRAIVLGSDLKFRKSPESTKIQIVTSLSTQQK